MVFPLPPLLSFQHHINRVHIAIVIFTMLEIVILLDNFLIIIVSKWTQSTLDREMILIPISIT